MVKKFSRRRDLLNSYCEDTTDEGPIDLEEFHFIENLPRPLIFCILKKVGSISINHYFINNLDENDQKSWLIGPSSDTRENIFKKRNPLKAMVTRHPFERLVSTFKHLFVTGLHDVQVFFCTKSPGCPETPNLYLAKEIIKILRPIAGENQTNLTFKKFVTYLIDSKERFLSLKQEMQEDYPDFENHWVPYSRYKLYGMKITFIYINLYRCFFLFFLFFFFFLFSLQVLFNLYVPTRHSSRAFGFES